LKQVAAKENKEAAIRSTLHGLSKPKTWELKNGKTVDVHTPHTTRARELAQLYHGINMPLMSMEERLDVLLHVKWTVKEFDCNLTREIVDLVRVWVRTASASLRERSDSRHPQVDREADLLNRGRSVKILEGLRKRISGLFLTFIETPEFFPVAARLQVAAAVETFTYGNVGRITSLAPARAYK